MYKTKMYKNSNVQKCTKLYLNVQKFYKNFYSDISRVKNDSFLIQSTTDLIQMEIENSFE